MFLDNNNGLATHSAGWWMLAKGVSHASSHNGPPTLESRLMKNWRLLGWKTLAWKLKFPRNWKLTDWFTGKLTNNTGSLTIQGPLWFFQTFIDLFHFQRPLKNFKMYINRYAGPIPLTASHLYSDEKPQNSTSGIIQTYPFFLIHQITWIRNEGIWTTFYGLSYIKVSLAKIRVKSVRSS